MLPDWSREPETKRWVRVGSNMFDCSEAGPGNSRSFPDASVFVREQAPRGGLRKENTADGATLTSGQGQREQGRVGNEGRGPEARCRVGQRGGCVTLTSAVERNHTATRKEPDRYLPRWSLLGWLTVTSVVSTKEWPR